MNKQPLDTKIAITETDLLIYALGFGEFYLRCFKHCEHIPSIAKATKKIEDHQQTFTLQLLLCLFADEDGNLPEQFNLGELRTHVQQSALGRLAFELGQQYKQEVTDDSE